MKKKIREKIKMLREAKEQRIEGAAETHDWHIRKWTYQAIGIVTVAAFTPLLYIIIPLFCLIFLYAIFFQPSEEVKGHRIAAALWILFVLPWLIAGLLSPARAICILIAQMLVPPSFPDLRGWFTASFLDFPVAMGGIVLAFAGGLYNMTVLRMQLAQSENLTAGHAGSAAIGLAEFRGVARSAPEHLRNTKESNDSRNIPEEYILYYSLDSTGGKVTERMRWSRFFLEDNTGRILVEPHGAAFWDGKASWLFEPLRKILLNKRLERSFMNPMPRENAFLLDRDPVYLIGNVEMREDIPSDAVDSERLVVRPSTELLRVIWFERFLFPGFIGKSLRKGKLFRHIFFLTDEQEVNVQEILDEARQQSFKLAAIWLFASAWLMIDVFRTWDLYGHALLQLLGR